jgi:pimeloyl-ACP methyl ester carboxylesterase
MALVAPFGIKPSDGFIADMYIGTTAEYLKLSIAQPEAGGEFAALFNSATPEVIESWEDARVETAQLAWEPYMNNPALEHHLPGLIGLPSLILWGEKDAILPRSAAEAYARAIPSARLEVLSGCGHRPEIERRDAFVAALRSFLD